MIAIGITAGVLTFVVWKVAFVSILAMLAAMLAAGTVIAAFALAKAFVDATVAKARLMRANETQKAGARRQTESADPGARSVTESGSSGADYGPENAARVDAAIDAVRRIAASEAARDGWLGDTDFTADIRAIADRYRKSHQLKLTAGKLSALANPSDDDRRIIADATAAARELDAAAGERVALIEKCATEARLIDESLRQERADAKTAQQRAELHAELSGMLYGIEATPAATAGPSTTADAVLARVEAYREIRQQIGR